jgi:ABC-type amino acid transport substrate-binding protein
MMLVGRRRILASALGLPMGVPLATSVSASGVESRVLRCGLIEAEPWILHGEPLKGVSLEVMDLLGKMAGIGMAAEIGPAARLLMALREGTIDLLPFVPLSALAPFAVNLGLMGSVEMVVIGRNGDPIGSLGDLAGRSIGFIRGGNLEPLVDRLPDGERVLLRDIGQGLAMLQGKRIDALLTSTMALHWHLRKSGLDRNLFGEPISLGSQESVLYLSRAAAVPPFLVDRLIRVLPAFRVEALRIGKLWLSADP